MREMKRRLSIYLMQLGSLVGDCILVSLAASPAFGLSLGLLEGDGCGPWHGRMGRYSGYINLPSGGCSLGTLAR